MSLPLTDQRDRSRPAGAPDPARWARMLDALAAPVLAGTPLADPDGADPADAAAFVDRFADELGHRRRVDRPFVAALLGVDPGPAPADAPLDVALWWVVARPGGSRPEVAPTGPLSAWPAPNPIEIWTEVDLCALHALWRLAGSAEERTRRRCLDAAAWHLEHTQPDNATNHPWGIHTFLVLAIERNRPEAMLYAEGLLHAARMGHAGLGPFSAAILLDASRQLARESAQTR